MYIYAHLAYTYYLHACMGWLDHARYVRTYVRTVDIHIYIYAHLAYTRFIRIL